MKRAIRVGRPKCLGTVSERKGIVSLWSDQEALRRQESSWALEDRYHCDSLVIVCTPPSPHRKPWGKGVITLPLCHLLSPFPKLHIQLQSHLLNETPPTTPCHLLLNSYSIELISMFLLDAVLHVIPQSPVGTSVDLLVPSSLSIPKTSWSYTHILSSFKQSTGSWRVRG